MDEMNFIENKIVFRSSVRGYNKKDVNKFIANENKKFADIEKSYIGTIRNLRFDLDNVREETSLLNRHAEELEHKLIDMEHERDSDHSKIESLMNTKFELEAEIARLTSECASLKKEIDDKDQVIEEYKKRAALSSAEKNEYEATVDALKTELEAAKMEADCANRCSDSANSELSYLAEQHEALAIESKADKAELMRLREIVRQSDTRPSVSVEQAESVASELLHKAKTASEEMLRRAEESTAVIMERARNEAASCRSDMLSTARDIITSVSGELHRSVDICMNDFVRGIRNAKNDSSLIADEVKRCGDDLGRRIERLQFDLDRTISEKLSEFDRKHGLFR
ncbi:MAG: hypothetical protein E7578_01140 [Ruminococcaceae bacterium]|nr:hypothetical protein [Oscillospiraceae bacterium]